MRRSDSSPSVSPRFVAFAQPIPSEHLGFAPSGRQVPRPRPRAWSAGARYPAVFKMETTRPPGFPGNPPARMPRCLDPGKVATSTASGKHRCSLPPNARRRPSRAMHFGAQSRGLRTPCERFASWVTPDPRITRFRLAADLGRMGLVTHRVSNKVSKITSRHLVPLDRAYPGTRAGALRLRAASFRYYDDRGGADVPVADGGRTR